jgi:hypothetical protein
MPNPIYMQRPRRHSDSVTVVLVQRIYLSEPDKGRFGGVDPPAIEPFLLSDPEMPAPCPSVDVSELISQFGSLDLNFSQSPLPRNGKIKFYRPPVTGVPFADGSNKVNKHDCTGYLMATVYPDQLAVVHLPRVPTFFDNTNTDSSTIFEESYDVRYLSMGSYGASPLGQWQNENIAGPDVKVLPDGSATFVAIPVAMSMEETRDVKRKAKLLGYNVMPLARYGPLIPFHNGGIEINPFLIYRNKVAIDGFEGTIENVACFQGDDFSKAPPFYAASHLNMHEYAPTGVECSVWDFVYGNCGQEF